MNGKVRILLAVALGVLAADQVTKYLAVSRLTSALDGRQGVDRLVGFIQERNLDNDPREEGMRSRTTRPYEVLENYWHFRYVENPGAAWGMFGNLPDGARRVFFAVASLAAAAFLFMMYRKLRPEQRFLQLALALVCGGAAGNIVDRFSRGYVIDFIDWHWRNMPGWRWPTFNVADAAISVGIGMLIFDSLFLSRNESGSEATEQPSKQSQAASP